MSARKRETSKGCNHLLWISLILTCWITIDQGVIADPSPPVITHDFLAGRVKEVGDRQVLKCRAYGQPTPTFVWLKNGQAFKETIEDTIELSPIQRSDAGNYQCIAKNSVGAVISKTARVQVAYITSFDSKSVPHLIKAQVGHAAIIPVPLIKSVPDADITWLNGTTKMPSEGRRYDYTTNQSLVLLDVTPQDNGTTFTAEADNTLNAKVTSQPFTIIVTNPDERVEKVEPEIVVPPKDTTATTNKESVRFICIVNSRPLNYTITWYHNENGKQIPLVGSRYVTSTSKRQINIKETHVTDSGEYTCNVQSPVGPPVTASAQLDVQDVPYITAGNLKHEKDYRQDALFGCHVRGVQPLDLKWYFNARLIKPSNRYSIFPNGSLLVKSVDISDAGSYQCFVSNIAGEMSIVHQLTVNKSPPEIDGSGLRNMSVLEGDDVRLVSQVKGAPKPSIVWLRNIGNGWQSLNSSGRIQLLQSSVLLITSTLPEDSGFYNYTAINAFGKISSQMYLHVLMKTQIRQPPQNQSVILGSTVVLKCTVSSDPSIPVTWVWYHRKPPSNTPVLIRADERHSITNGTLKIKSISGMDVGLYTCFVISSAGNTSRNATIKVMELPFPPIIVSVIAHQSSPGSVSIAWTPGDDGKSPIKGYIIQYKEIIQASPTSLIKPSWISYPDKIEASITNYTIHGLQPALYYKFRVRAVNNVGEGKPSVPAPDPPLLIPQQPPSGAPTNLVGRSRSNSSIILQWLIPEKKYRNGPLLGFNIRYNLQGYANLSMNEDILKDPDLTRHTIVGLVPFTSYNIKIAARNAKGVGVFSPSISVWTEEGRPTAAPTQIVCTAVNSTSVKVQWKAPDSSQIFGLLKGYTVFARPFLKNESLPTVRENVDVDIINMYGMQQGFINGLQKYSRYSISVTGFTHKGAGPESEACKIRTLEDVPDEVNSLSFQDVTDRSLVVVWTPPTKTNGILTGYQLTYRKKNSSSEEAKNVKNLRANELTCKVENLLPTTVYTISVAAATSVGVGPKRSAEIKSGSTPVLPTEPSNLGISNIETTSVQLQFTPGFNGKTSITKWIVQAQIEDDTEWTDIFSMKAPDATYLTVAPLVPYTHYILRMIAQNIVGQSDPSLPSRRFQTKQAPPAKPPGNLTVWAVNETALRISWTLLTRRDWNGEPRGYNLFYKMNDPNVEWTIIHIENAVNNYSYILTGLNEWVEYQVKMTSFNSVGKSPFSPMVVQKTMESVPSSGPSNVTGKALSSTRIKIQWGDVPQFEQNGFILGYKIIYLSRDAKERPNFRTVSNNTNSITLKRLLKYVVYDIKVLAFTKMGDGVSSKPTLSIRTLEDVPDPPIIIYFPVVTYKMARVVWAPPTKPNGIIISYRVSYALRDKPDDKQESYTIVDANVHEFTASGLERETYYNFSVSAKTNVGWGKPAIVEVFTMKDRSAPESPSQPIISSQVQARSVPISWQNGNDGYGPLRNFTIQFQTKEQDEKDWDTVPDVVPPDVTTFMVTGLKPNTTYRFRVAATNDIGTSSFSNSSDDVNTLQDVPEQGPTEVKVVSITTDSVNVTWRVPPPKTWNGPLLGFIVQYRQDDLKEFQQEDVIYVSKQTAIWYRLSNLNKFINYEFRVIAYNAIGESPASKPFIYFVGYAPPSGAPVNVTAEALNGTRVKVTWDPPPQISQNGKISGYKVFYYFVSKPEKTKRITTLNNFVVLDHLAMFSRYAISILAFNTAGQGPSTEEIIVQTKQGAPGPPRNLTFFSIMLRSLNVSWIPPKKKNGIIKYYEVTYYQKFTDAEGRKMVQLNVPGNQLFYHAKELVENKTYIFTVRAKTIQPGKKVMGSITTGPQKGSPVSPGKPQCEMTNRGVNISWTNQGEGNYPILKYLLQARKEDLPNSANYRTKRENGAVSTKKGVWLSILLKESPQTDALLNVHSLDAGDIYQFRVMAINWLGVSYPSEPSDAIRIEDPSIGSPVDGKRHLVSRPFHSEWWFLVIIALSGLIVIMTVILLLVLVGRKRKLKRESMRKRNTPPLPLEPPPVDDGGFSTFDRRQSRRNLSLRTGSLRSMRAPPRPSPASVTYSDDDNDAKPPLDDNSSSLTEKPDIEELTEPSEDESELESTKDPGVSTATGTFYNQYVNDTVRQSWQQSNPKSMYGAYNYTDSEEAESSTYGMSINGGYMMVNNTAGSRTPVAGFSSFV